MDGTFGGGDLISASLAIMLGGGTDAELHEKSVFFSLNMITASETGIFEYDPQDEPPSGRPPGPWDGYNFFTVDLSTVKDNIEDMLARIAALEDELEDCHDCWEDVVAKLQEYDPDYDPDEGECPTEEIGKVVDEKEHEIETLEEQIEECDQCKADVIAKLQEYDPDFDPVTCSDIPPEIDEIVEENKKYEFDEDVPIADISKIVANDPIGSANSDYYLKVYVHAFQWGVTPPQVYEGRTVYATSETGELSAQMCADVVDGSGAAIRHYITSGGYSVFPQLNGYAQISDYSITNDTITINMFVYRNDGWSSTQTTTFTDLLFADFATGPYTVKNS